MKPSEEYAERAVAHMTTQWLKDEVRAIIIGAYEQGEEDGEWRLREALRGETIQ